MFEEALHSFLELLDSQEAHIGYLSTLYSGFTPLVDFIPLLQSSFAIPFTLNKLLLPFHVQLLSIALLLQKLLSLTFGSFADHATCVGLYSAVRHEGLVPRIFMYVGVDGLV